MKKLLFSMFALMMGFSVMTQAQNASVAGGGEATGATGKMSFTVGQVAYQFVSGADKNVNEGVQQSHSEDHLMINTVIKGLGEVDSRDYDNFIKVDYNSDTLFMIQPVEGWHIENVTVNGTELRKIQYYQFENIKEDQNITVEFAIDQYTITASKIGNGTITDEGVTEITYDSAATYPYTITPDEGYMISEVLINNKPIELPDSVRETSFTYTFANVLGDSTISAMFAASKYTITATANDNGVLSPNGTATVDYGTSKTYTAKANVGYYIEKVTIDTTETEYTQDDNMTTYEYTFENIVANHTIDVMFAQASYVVTAEKPENGTITPEGDSTYKYGESPVYTITPDEGFAIEDVTVDGSSVGAVESYTFSNIKEDHTIAATFKQITYNIVASAGAHGTIDPVGTVEVNYNADTTFTITPDEGYQIATLKVDGKEVDTASTYKFEKVTANHTISVTFTAITYEIVATAGEGGKINPEGTVVVKHGANQSFAITPDKGYSVKAIKVDDAEVDSIVLPYVFENVTENHTIAVEFAIDSFVITAIAGEGGTIDPEGETTVAYGANQVYTMKANPGFYIDYVKIDGTKAGAKESYEFKNIAADHTIEVAFVAEGCDKPLSLVAKNITDSSATLTWKGFSDKYSVQYKAESDTEYTVIEDLTELTYELTGLTEETTYMWAVKGYCDLGDTLIESEMSSEETFTTLKKQQGGGGDDPSGINDLTIASVKVYSHNDKVYIVNEQNIVVKNVEIFDANGRVVYVGGALNSTRTEIQLSLAVGNYVVRLSNDNASASYKVMLTNF